MTCDTEIAFLVTRRAVTVAGDFDAMKCSPPAGMRPRSSRMTILAVVLDPTMAFSAILRLILFFLRMNNEPFFGAVTDGIRLLLVAGFALIISLLAIVAF